MTAENGFDSQVLATTLMGVVGGAIEEMANTTFTKDPEFAQKDLIEYDGRMRADGMEKFNGPCYVAAISYYLSTKELKKHDACGAFVLYVNEEFAEKVMHALGHKHIEAEDEESVLDGVGELCNLLSGNFKSEISNLGYKDLSMSAPVKHRNTIPEGIEFSYDQYDKYECSFYLWNEKTIVVDITMAKIPNK